MTKSGLQFLNVISIYIFSTIKMIPTKIIKQLDNNQGVSLLYAILVLAGAVILSYAIGVLTLRGLRQSEDIGKGMIAYYAAESGLEEGIYEALVNGVTSGTGSGNFGVDPPASWDYTISRNQPYLLEVLEQDRVVHFDNLPSCSMTLCWNPGNPVCGSLGDIEITHAEWDNDFGNFNVYVPPPSTLDDYIQTDQTVFKEVILETDLGTMFIGGKNRECISRNFTGDNNLVRIKALEDAICELYVDFDEPIDDKIRVVSVGDYAGLYQRALEATVDYNLGTKRHFDYVIFSETDLLKP